MPKSDDKSSKFFDVEHDLAELELEAKKFDYPPPGISLDPKDHIWIGERGELNTVAILDLLATNLDRYSADERVARALVLGHQSDALERSSEWMKLFPLSVERRRSVACVKRKSTRS